MIEILVALLLVPVVILTLGLSFYGLWRVLELLDSGRSR